MSSDRLLCGMLGSQLGMQSLRGDWILRIDPLRDSHYGDSPGRRGLMGGGAHWGHPLWAILSWALPFYFLPSLSLFFSSPILFFSSLPFLAVPPPHLSSFSPTPIFQAAVRREVSITLYCWVMDALLPSGPKQWSQLTLR